MFWLVLYFLSSNLKIKLFVLKNNTYYINFKMNKPAISKTSHLLLKNTFSVVTNKAKFNRQLNLFRLNLFQKYLRLIK